MIPSSMFVVKFWLYESAKWFSLLGRNCPIPMEIVYETWHPLTSSLEHLNLAQACFLDRSSATYFQERRADPFIKGNIVTFRKHLESLYAYLNPDSMSLKVGGSAQPMLLFRPITLYFSSFAFSMKRLFTGLDKYVVYCNFLFTPKFTYTLFLINVPCPLHFSLLCLF